MNKKLLLAALILAVMLIAMFFMSKIKFEDFTLTDEYGKNLAVEIPYSAKAPRENGIYTYKLKGKVHLNFFSPRAYKIIPDDKILSLAINGEDISLASIPASKKSDYKNGFTINLSKYLHNGENSIEITYEDYGGLMGMKIQPTLRDSRGIVASVFIFLLLLFVMFVFSKKIQLPKRYTFILFLAIVVRVLYLSVTDYNVREHDVYSHLDYIKYFVENKSLPPLENARGGAFFHPPLYYMSSALVYSGVSYVTNNNTSSIYFSLQILSLLTSIGFVFFGIKLIRLVFAYFIKRDSLLLQKILPWLSCLLIALWPSGIIHSIRIGNDSFLYLFFVAAMYSWACFYLHRKSSRHLFMASICTALAILTKLNGALLIPVAIIFFILKVISGKISFSRINIIKGVLASLVMTVALGAALYPGVVLKSEGKRSNVYITNMHGSLIVGTNLENILWLDVKTFVNEPFTSPFIDKYGRQFFPNYMGKTALFGEFAYSGKTMHNICVALSIVTLAMFFIFIIFLFKVPVKDIRILLPIFCIPFFLIGGVTYTRITFPVNIDFRYILPIIIPFSIFYNYGINLLINEGKRRFAISAVFLELFFCLFSVLFVIELFIGFTDSWIIK